MFPVYSIQHFGNLLNQPASTNFLLCRIEELADHAISVPHKHDFYEILWLQKGVGYQSVEYLTYPIEADTLFFISPGQVHFLGKRSGLEGYVLMFTEDFFRLNIFNKNTLFELTYLTSLHARPCLTLTLADTATLGLVFRLLMDESRAEMPNDDSLRALLVVLLNQLQRKAHAPDPVLPATHHQLLFGRLITLLESHFIENRPVSYYASALNLTPHHLNVVVKGVVGQTVGHVIRSRSLLEAKRLLSFSDLTIAQIANRLGYQDSSYLTRALKRNVGLTAAGFRNEYTKSTH